MNRWVRIADEHKDILTIANARLENFNHEECSLCGCLDRALARYASRPPDREARYPFRQ